MIRLLEKCHFRKTTFSCIVCFDNFVPVDWYRRFTLRNGLWRANSQSKYSLTLMQIIKLIRRLLWRTCMTMRRLIFILPQISPIPMIFLKRSHHYSLSSFRWLVALSKYARESLGDRGTTLAGNKAPASVLRNEQ